MVCGTLILKKGDVMNKKILPINLGVKVVFTLFLTTALLPGATTAQATNERYSSSHEDGDSDKYRIPGKSADHIKKALKHAVEIGLSDSKKKLVADIYIKAKGESAAIKAESEVIVTNFMSLYKQGKVTEEAIRDYAGKMGDLKTRFLLNNLKAMNDVKKILTQGQREIIHNIYKTHGKGGGEKHE